MHAMHSFVIIWFDAIKEKAPNALIKMAFITSTLLGVIHDNVHDIKQPHPVVFI